MNSPKHTLSPRLELHWLISCIAILYAASLIHSVRCNLRCFTASVPFSPSVVQIAISQYNTLQSEIAQCKSTAIIFAVRWCTLKLLRARWGLYAIAIAMQCNAELREACIYQNGWISGKFPKGGGVISDLKNFIAIFFALEMVILVMNFRKKT